MKIYSKLYFEIMFYLGLLLGVAVALNNRYDYLNAFSDVFLKVLALVFILVGGTLSHSVKFIRKSELRENDERLQLLSGKAYESMFFISSILATIIAIVCVIIGGKLIYVALTIVFVLILEKIVYLVSYTVINKKI